MNASNNHAQMSWSSLLTKITVNLNVLWILTEEHDHQTEGVTMARLSLNGSWHITGTAVFTESVDFARLSNPTISIFT
jgi:hypothetical protein